MIIEHDLDAKDKEAAERRSEILDAALLDAAMEELEEREEREERASTERPPLPPLLLAHVPVHMRVRTRRLYSAREGRAGRSVRA